MRAEHGDPKDLECTKHEACGAKNPKNLYNTFTLGQHISHFDSKQLCGHPDCGGATNRYGQRQLKLHEEIYHGGPRTLALLSSYANSEDDFEGSGLVDLGIDNDHGFDGQDYNDQAYLDGRSEGRPDNEANPGIVIDVTARPLRIIFTEASEGNPGFWTVQKTHCPIKNCRLNEPQSILAVSLLPHVENVHGLSRWDSRLGLHDRVDCTVPDCKKTFPASGLEEHVRNQHYESSGVRCGHDHCMKNQRRYGPGQLLSHTFYVHAPKTIPCTLPGCEDSGELYNATSHSSHISNRHVKLLCSVPDCDDTIQSWVGMQRHNFNTSPYPKDVGKYQS